MKLTKYLQLQVQEVKSIHDMHTGMSRIINGKLDVAWYDYIIDFKAETEMFLDEKGVIYDSFHPDNWDIHLVLVDVNKRLYHEVVVPGLVHLCKQWSMVADPDEYIRKGKLRILEVFIRPNRTKIWEQALKEYKNESLRSLSCHPWFDHVSPGSVLKHSRACIQARAHEETP